jgi:DNA-binding NarL/FixJ family response regulator
MEQTRLPRVLLCDDHLLVAEALKSLLTPEFELVGVVQDGRAMVEAAATLRPDIIVADISMPRLNGIDALVQLRQSGDRVPVVFLTMRRDVIFARRALEAGASGFVLKHSAPAELVLAIRAALDGQTYLTPQLADEAGTGTWQRPDCVAHAAATGSAAAAGGRAVGEGSLVEPLNLDPDGRVSQIPDHGDTGPSHQRRADSFRHQARSRGTLGSTLVAGRFSPCRDRDGGRGRVCPRMTGLVIFQPHTRRFPSLQSGGSRL